LYGVNIDAGCNWSIIDLTRVSFLTARRNRRRTASRRRLRRWLSEWLLLNVDDCEAISNADDAFLKCNAANKAGPNERWYGPRNRCKVSSRISNAVKIVYILERRSIVRERLFILNSSLIKKKKISKLMCCFSLIESNRNT